MLKKVSFKASSLTKAVFLCLIISIFCGCLVMLSYYQNVLLQRFDLEEKLMRRNTAAFNYLIKNSDELDYGVSNNIDVLEDGYVSVVEKKQWGFYDIFLCKTGFGTDTISKINLMGFNSYKSNKLALYVTDYDIPVKFSGKIEISGDVKIPNGKYEQTYINGKKGNNVKIKGKQLKSERKLPKVDKSIVVDLKKGLTIDLQNENQTNVFTNSFHQKTKIINMDETFLPKGFSCKGNFILNSNSTIAIDSSFKLNDVIVNAEKIIVKSGFKGNVQIVAGNEVVIEDNVMLYYPSSVYVKNDIDTTSVFIGINSKLAGGVVITGNLQSASSTRKLLISQGAKVIGDVYCFGSTELKGAIIGTLYSDRLFLKTKSSKYENTLLNTIINRNRLPNHFVGLPLFEEHNKEGSYEVIKRL
jgi:hypothetical protein